MQSRAGGASCDGQTCTPMVSWRLVNSAAFVKCDRTSSTFRLGNLMSITRSAMFRIFSTPRKPTQPLAKVAMLCGKPLSAGAGTTSCRLT